MAVSKLCRRDELRQGDLVALRIADRDVLVAWPEDGEPVAFDDKCPHQGISLSDGYLDGMELVCAAHQWTFDVRTGTAIDPPGSGLTRYPLQIDGDDVFIDVDA